MDLPATDVPRKKPKPFVKWAGGKRQLLIKFRELYPAEFGTYHEPFVGGGAVFFDLTVIHGSLAGRAVLSDQNTELMDCYRAIRDEVGELMRALRRHKYEEKYYYAQRERDPARLSLVQRAARMIYLNRTGFNGLYRVNSKGKFNVPFGRHKNPTICDGPNLLACSAALADVDLHEEPFEAVLDRARKGDFVYLDPPYIPLSATANFTAYQKHGFGMANQDKLADVFDALAGRGAKVMLSNSDVPWVHERYARHDICVLKARRAVNSNGARRGPVGEVVVTNY
jgi:DNA adenine methylase